MGNMVRAQMGVGGNGVRSKRRLGSGGKSRSNSCSQDYKSCFASGGDRLAGIVSPTWGKLGAWRRSSSLTCKALARAVAGGKRGRRPPGSYWASRLARTKLKCPGRMGNASRKGALGSAGPSKLGKLSQVAAQPPRAVCSRSCCLWSRSPPSAELRAAPAPSPAHCSCGSGRCLPTRYCSGGGVRGEEILTGSLSAGTLESPG